jgi:hypothetical protein
MPIKANFTEAQLQQLKQKKAENVHKAITSILFLLGEKCVNEARNFGSYTDRTGNLRSSVGYGVFKDGRPISYSDFQQVAKGTEGGIEGRALLDRIAGQYPSGYALVVVAGMKYAVYVEAKGYNVLSSAELLAERELPRMINELFD